MAYVAMINFDVIVQYLDNNRTEELYKYLVIALCNQLSGCLPQMFERISERNPRKRLLYPLLRAKRKKKLSGIICFHFSSITIQISFKNSLILNPIIDNPQFSTGLLIY